MGPGCARAAGYEPTDEYTLPGIVFTDRPEELTGIWRCRYFVKDGTVCTFSSYVKSRESKEFCFVYEGEKLAAGALGPDYEIIIDPEKVCEIWGPLRQTAPLLPAPDGEFIPGRYYLLQDGNMMTFISYEDGEHYEAFVFSGAE